MLRYAITSRSLFPGSEMQKAEALAHQCRRWAEDGIDYIQLREKDLPASAQVALTGILLQTLAAEALSAAPKLLINSRPDVAIASGAHGVHLTSAPGELTAGHVRDLYARAGLPRPIVSRSCHTLPEVAAATFQTTDLILFGPILGKWLQNSLVVAGIGFEVLAEACRIAAPSPVLALGGIGTKNADACLRAGAAGIAGIRSFLE